MRLFRLADGEVEQTWAGAFHHRLPDGHTLVVNDWKRLVVERRDDRSGTVVGVSFTTNDNPALAIGATPDGRWLVVAAASGGFRLYDLIGGQPVGDRFPTVGANSVWAVGALPEFASGDGAAVLWDLDPASWADKACAVAGRNLSRPEWDRHLPGEPYRPTCPAFAPGRGA
jgi:hypothetical protein